MYKRPLARYGLPPPRGNFVDHIFLKAQCLARILQHISPLAMAVLTCNSLLHTLLLKIFDNLHVIRLQKSAKDKVIFPIWLYHRSKLLLHHRYRPLKTNIVAPDVTYVTFFH